MPGNQTVAQRNLTCAIRIRERRRLLSLTQAELADRMNEHGARLSTQALSAIENGRRLDVGRLPDLAAALQCTVSYLLGLTDDPDRWAPDDPGRWAPGETDRWAPGDASPPEPASPAPTPGRPPSTPPPSTPPPNAPPPSAQLRRGWILGPDLPDAVPSPPRSS
jgi:transcriptional regulator with XRE-family HTH domain